MSAPITLSQVAKRGMGVRSGWRTLSRASGDLFNNVRARLYRLRGTPPVRAFWFTRVPNFGDLLTRLILEYLGVPVVYAPAQRAQFFGVGSIIHNIPPTFRGTILGAGLIKPEDAPALPHARILALRGHLTRQILGAPADIALGDPGLLAVKLSGIAANPVHTLGIVPHYTEKGHPLVRDLAARYPREVRVINVQQPPQTVFRAIASCHTIISSSLHGLVTADALGIPNRHLVVSGKLIGGEFKFHDYYSAFGESVLGKSTVGEETAPLRAPLQLTAATTLRELLGATCAPPPQVDAVIADLAAVYDRFVAAHRAGTAP